MFFWKDSNNCDLDALSDALANKSDVIPQDVPQWVYTFNNGGFHLHLGDLKTPKGHFEINRPLDWNVGKWIVKKIWKV